MLQKGEYRFRFEASWLQEENCSKVIEEEWANSSAEWVQGVAEKMKRVAGKLESWSREEVGDLEAK